MQDSIAPLSVPSSQRGQRLYQFLLHVCKNGPQRHMLRTGLLAHAAAGAGGQPVGDLIFGKAARSVTAGIMDGADRAIIHASLAGAAGIELFEQGIHVGGQGFA